MGTGVNGSEHRETAAEVMRRGARDFRRRAEAADQATAKSREEIASHEERAAWLRAEADKLEQAAELIEPMKAEPVASTYEPIGDVADFKTDRKVPLDAEGIKAWRPAIARLWICAYNHAGAVVRATDITAEEIDNGFLAPLPEVLLASPQARTWQRLRKMAGLE